MKHAEQRNFIGEMKGVAPDIRHRGHRQPALALRSLSTPTQQRARLKAPSLFYKMADVKASQSS